MVARRETKHSWTPRMNKKISNLSAHLYNFLVSMTGTDGFMVKITNSTLTHIGWTVGRGVLWQVENFTLWHSWRNVGVGSIVPAHARRWRWSQRVGACHMWCLRDTIEFIAEFCIASYYCLESHKDMCWNNVKGSQQTAGPFIDAHLSRLIQVLLNNKIVNRTTTTFEHMFDLICLHNKVC